MATNGIGKHFSSNESSDNFQQKRKTENKIERKNEFANNQFDWSHFLSHNCRLVFALRAFTILQLGGMSDIMLDII